MNCRSSAHCRTAMLRRGTICKIALDRLILSTAKDAKARHCCDLVVDAGRPADRTPLQARAVRSTRRRQRRAWARSWAGPWPDEGPQGYEALDWLFERQARIENGLARRHHEHGVLVLYDVSSSYFESRHYPLAHYGHSRDHRVDRLQTFTACRARGTACLCGRSVRGQYGGSDDAEIADREAEIALRYQADGCWSATGHDHHGLDRRGSQIIRLGLDYVLACAANSSAGPRPWAAAAVAVR
jgi:hypothetical protein